MPGGAGIPLGRPFHVVKGSRESCLQADIPGKTSSGAAGTKQRTPPRSKPLQPPDPEESTQKWTPQQHKKKDFSVPQVVVNRKLALS